METIPLAPPQPGTLDLASVFAGLRRRKRAFLAAFIVVNAAVAAITFSIPKRYLATATLAVEASEPKVLAAQLVAKGLPPILPGDSSVMSTQVNTLRSRALASEVVSALGLDRQPLPPGLVSKAVQAVRDRIPPAWAEAVLPPVATPAPDVLHEQAVDRFLERLSVGQQGESRIIAVSFTASSPAQAARVANELVSRYLAHQLAAKTETTSRALAWAEGRASEMEKQVVAAEEAVASYMAATGLSRAPDGGLEQQQLATLQSGLAAARVEQAGRSVQLGQLRELGSRSGGYATLPDVENSRLITALQQQAATLRTQEAQLSIRFGAQHPSVQAIVGQRAAIERKIAEQTTSIAHTVENEAHLAAKREQALEQALARGKAEFASSERAAVQLRQLARTATAKRTLYESLLLRTNEIREQQGLLEPDARVVSPATPPVEPSFPRTGIFLLGGIVASVAAGTLIAAAREHFDAGLRTPRQAEEALAIPNFGLVPRLRRRRAGRLQRFLFEDPRGAFAEAIRTVGHTVRARSGGSHQVLLVTSALPGEGKTTIALSLAAVAARSGARVVVVDLDLRHASLGGQFRHRGGPGVTEYLSGARTLDEVVYAHEGERHLHLLPAGGPVDSPGDLLASPQLRALIADLYLRYEFIVLDLPPALGLGDVSSVAQLADVVLLAVNWGRTSAAVVSNAVHALDRAGATVTGTVLNRVDLRRYGMYAATQPREYNQLYRRYLLN